jgi:hypothetical protein
MMIRPNPPAGEGSVTHISSITALRNGDAVDVWYRGHWWELRRYDIFRMLRRGKGLGIP